MEKKNIKKLILIFVFILFVSKISYVSAATIFVNPREASVSENSTFTVSVRVNTDGKTINVAESRVSFPSNILRVVSVTPGDTFSLQTPGSPSKSDSEVFFSAGLPSPGYKGADGLLGRITFKAIGTGVATISVKGGKVLLNDGNATDVFSAGSSSSITITPQQPKEETTTKTPETTTTTPQEPVVTPVDFENITPTQENMPQSSQIVASFNIVISVHDLVVIIIILLAIILVLLALIIYLLIKNNSKTKVKTQSQPQQTQAKNKVYSKTIKE